MAGSYTRVLCPNETPEAEFRWRAYRWFFGYLKSIHEAAHAVAAIQVGSGCIEVTLEPDVLYDGSATFERSNPERFPEKSLLRLFAGCAAEMLLGVPEQNARWDARHDFANAEPILTAAGEFAEEWLARAGAVVRTNLRAIELVAEALRARRTLKGNEIVRLIEVADGLRKDAELTPLPTSQSLTESSADDLYGDDLIDIDELEAAIALNVPLPPEEEPSR